MTGYREPVRLIPDLLDQVQRGLACLKSRHPMVSISVYAVEARPSSGAFRDNSQAYFMRDQFLYDFSSDPQVPLTSIDKQDVWYAPLPF